MFSKCGSTARLATTCAKRGGSPVIIGPAPARISRNITAKPTLNAVIWLGVTLEAHNPTAVNAATSSTAPTYCATITPACRSAPSDSPSGIVRVSVRAMQLNSSAPRYLPTTSSNSVMGCASTTSSVPERTSSDSVRIVTAGAKHSRTHGSRPSIGRSVAMSCR